MTGRDRCEWQANGPAGEVDLAQGAVASELDRRVRSVLSDYCLVGKRECGAAAG
jgi:hypothetical protein